MTVSRKSDKAFDVIFNPKGIESTYIECLNRCFSDWGGRDMYNWCFNRQASDLTTDIMILKKDGDIVAGSAVTYRKVLLANNSKINVGIMTGSWTLPHARGQGCFTKIIDESMTLASGKGAILLSAFVTRDNASFRRLVDAGSLSYPTHYLFSDENIPPPESDYLISTVLDVREGIEIIFERLKKRQAGNAHFAYTQGEWQSQFLGRPGETEFLCLNDGCFAIIEKKQNLDRILFLSLNENINFEGCIKALLKRASINKRRLFFFTTSEFWKDECVSLGFSYSPGCLTTLVANENELVKACLGVSALAKNSRNEFYKPPNFWDINSWDIQCGDRM